MIQVDTYEPGEIAQAIRALQAQVEVVALPFGDYYLHTPAQELVAIERKTVSDLLNSIASGRLADQLSRCLTGAKVTILLIEERLDTWSIGSWTWLSIRNYLLSLKVAGVVIEQTENLEQTASRLVQLEQYFAKPTHAALIAKHGEVNRRVAGLTWIQGIGPITAEKVLSNLHTLHNVGAATVQGLVKAGANKTQAQHIYAAFHEAERPKGMQP